MMKKLLKKSLNSDESGIVIILTLGLLALISLLCIAYVNLAIIDKKASYNYNALHQARMIVQSTCQRAIALSASQLSSSAAKATDVYTYNTNHDSDGLAELLQTTVEGKTYCSVQDYSVTKGPHWQYIPENHSSTTPIIGRFAYTVVADQGRIDPSAASYNYSTEDGSSISGRPGRDIGEVKLNAVGTWFGNNESGLLLTNSDRWNSFDSIFDILSITDDDKQDSYRTYFVLDEEPDPEAFWSDNGDLQRESSELFHRFNLARNDWNSIEVDSILSQPLPYDSSTSQSDIFSIPWINNWASTGDFPSVDSCRNQIAANLIDYNDADTIATADNADSPSYVGLEKCPYINELRLEFEGEVQSGSGIGGGGNSLFAGGDLSIYASSLQLNSCNGHTNENLKLSGGSITGTGTFYYAGSLLNSGGLNVVNSNSATSPISTDINVYKAQAVSTGTYFTGDIAVENGGNGKVKITGNVEKDEGCVIYTTGNITVSSSLNRNITLISENGDIKISCGVSLTPAYQNVLIYAGGKVEITGWSTYILSGFIIGNNGISITPGGSVTIYDAYIWSNGDINIGVYGSANISCSSTTTEESQDYVCNVYLKDALLELVDMYGTSMNCKADITIDGSYNWVIDGADSEVNFSKNFILDVSGNNKAYSVSSSFDLADSDISPSNLISGATGLSTSIDDFQITGLKVKLTDTNTNLLDFSYIVDPSYTVSVAEKSGVEVDGDLNINPGSSNSSHPFTMKTSGGEIDIDDLRAWSVSDTYTGTATEIKLKAKRKGQGGTSLTINGETVYLHSGTYYTFTGSMSVYLRNSHSNGQAEGNWWIDISGSNISIDPGYFNEESTSSAQVTTLSEDGSKSVKYFDYQINDPRQNLLQTDWDNENITSDGLEVSVTANGTLGSKNSTCLFNIVDDTHDLEIDATEPWGISTAYIRNAPMESPWEIGLIHRGKVWQTLNIKKYNMSEGMRGGGNLYSDGDANILDQIKMTSENFVYGKININTELRGVLEALFEDIPRESSLTTPGTGATMLNASDAGSFADNTISSSSVQPFYTRAQILRPERQLENEPKITGVDKLHDGTLIDQDNDAEQEEVIGKFINLTKALLPNEYTIIVVAQTIKDVGGVTINNVECQTGRYDEGGDLILATQKALAVVRWNKDTKKFSILRYQYIND